MTTTTIGCVFTSMAAGPAYMACLASSCTEAPGSLLMSMSSGAVNACAAALCSVDAGAINPALAGLTGSAFCPVTCAVGTCAATTTTTAVPSVTTTTTTGFHRVTVLKEGHLMETVYHYPRPYDKIVTDLTSTQTGGANNWDLMQRESATSTSFKLYWSSCLLEFPLGGWSPTTYDNLQWYTDSAAAIKRSIESHDGFDVFFASMFLTSVQELSNVSSLTIQGIGISLAAAFLVVTLLTRNPIAGLVLTIQCLLAVLMTWGFMYYVKLEMNMYSILGLLITVGMSVEASAHIIVAASFGSGSATERIQDAAQLMFVPVIAGSITSVFGILPLYDHPVALVRKFFCYQGIIYLISSLLGGLIATPLLYMLFGTPYHALLSRCAKEEEAQPDLQPKSQNTEDDNNTPNKDNTESKAQVIGEQEADTPDEMHATDVAADFDPISVRVADPDVY